MTAPRHNYGGHASGQNAQYWQQQQRSQPQQNVNQISELITYAKCNYEENPTEALGALMEAMKLNSGQEAVNRAMQLLQQELGDEVAQHVSSRHLRMRRAVELVEELMADESTFLHQRGQQDLLRQAMQDGSSVVCSRCNDVLSASRWQQHQQYWCSAIENDGGDGDDDSDMDQSG